MRLRQHDSQLYIVVLLELIYGMRRGEALGLRWQDIDFASGRIHISGQYTVRADHKPEWKPQAKTKSSRRDLVTVISTLGHSKIETTQRYLSEDFEVSARVANQVVANIFDSTPAKEKQKKSV